MTSSAVRPRARRAPLHACLLAATHRFFLLRAQLFGADEVYRTTKTKIKHAPVPKLLAQTREEEAQARKAGMDKSAPKQYQFIKESLDALEAQYKAKDMAVREKAYERTRRGLHVSGKNVDVGDEDDDEVEDLRSKLSKMSDEEFKQLAMERKKRAEEQLSGKEEESSKSERVTNGTSDGEVDVSDAVEAEPQSTGGGKGKGGGGGGRVVVVVVVVVARAAAARATAARAAVRARAVAAGARTMATSCCSSQMRQSRLVRAVRARAVEEAAAADVAVVGSRSMDSSTLPTIRTTSVDHRETEESRCTKRGACGDERERGDRQAVENAYPHRKA